jgi:hypothetical protein
MYLVSLHSRCTTLSYHTGREEITSRTITELPFFYTENKQAVRAEADQRKVQIEHDSGLAVWEEELRECPMGFTATSRWLLPGSRNSFYISVISEMNLCMKHTCSVTCGKIKRLPSMEEKNTCSYFFAM